MKKNKILLKSPKENIAQNEVVLVTNAEVRIKELILSNRFNGDNKKEIEKEILKIIQETASKINNPILKQQAIRSLKINAQKWFYETDIKFKKIKKYVSNAFGSVYSLPIGNDGSVNLSQFDTSFRDKITLSKQAGVPLIKDYDKAIKQTIKSLSSQPTEYVDKNGKKMSLRNLAEMKTRYDKTLEDVSKLKEKAKNNKDEYADLVWTSSHSDCSLRCQPYQGRLFSISGKTGVINGIKYTPLDEALAGLKGDGNGIISGYNCRHTLIPYNGEKQGPREYSSKEIAKERAINQKQRYMERNIRNAKVEEKLLRRIGTKESLQQAKELRLKWRKETIKYQSFSLKNGRAYYLWRTRITEDEIENQDQ